MSANDVYYRIREAKESLAAIMIVRNLQEAEAALKPYVPLVKQLVGKGTTLGRMKPLMKLLGNPQDKLKIIHIAGTSGKTSTAYYLAALIRAAGYKVGLTVSPYIDSITERLQINGQPLAEARFCEELSKFLTIVQAADVTVSYFELLCAFALWVFERQAVDYAVIETGLGGLHDATNVAARPDKLCVITDIGFDHMSVLGRSLAEIAAQKIGIVHEGNEVCMYGQDPEIMQVVEAWARQHHAVLHVTTEAELAARERQLATMPAYQKRNWLLAHFVYEQLRNRDNLQYLTSQTLRQTQQIIIPGRLEIHQVRGKTLIMDGAHNTQKLQALVGSFRGLYPAIKPAILVAFKADKAGQRLVPLLSELASRVIVTEFHTTQDLPVSSMPAEHLAVAFAKYGVPATVERDHVAAFKKLLAGPETACIITGSFYLLHQIRNNKHIHDQIDSGH